MGLFDSIVPFKGQVYKDLKNKAIKTGVLFTDPEFPPSGLSIYFSKPAYEIEWKRPGELVEKPKFFEDGESSDDLAQGEIGDCWFVAACACLAKDSKLREKIVPDYKEQEWDETNKYAGIFHFKFWRCGTWVDVVIDDYLPTRNRQLVSVRSKAPNEFWSALLEKAYAKLAGCYESLNGGSVKDALVDMTGGVGESLKIADYTTHEQRKELFRILQTSKAKNALMSAGIDQASGEDKEAKMSCGLVKGHAYSVTAVKEIKLGKGLLAFFKRETLEMVRCRNPWGETEWNGAWSDGSQEWKEVSEGRKKEIGLTFDDNGEFWMSFEDFCCHFTWMDICHIFNLSVFSMEKTWREGKVNEQWSEPNRCGGCQNNNTFLQNPQYIFDIVKDEDEVMISLEQKDKRVEKGANDFAIGFTILRTDLNREYRIHDILEEIYSGPFESLRSVFHRVKLFRGRYCIIPCTFYPRHCGEFVLRMYASKELHLTELLHEDPQPGNCLCIQMRRKQVSATQITLVRAEGLEKQDMGGTADPYCIVKCEGHSMKCHYKEKTVNPEWNVRLTLYRKKPNEDIKVEVWNYNCVKDQLMGIATVPMNTPSNYTGQVGEHKLYVKGKKGPVSKPGTLWLKVLHSGDMAAV
ncbi:calpain-5-like [Dreissena polymorpha]|uniref:Calpain-5 n=1 Tax=Dreissena polymorpha TaxID=45954 RepID=A0A9D4L0E1_DREPO|nr:calpain-5-like [Dreissena polymorpha]KAH3848959.1 hypothetical protein DPMN_091344 [Dreissena polymorpha]